MGDLITIRQLPIIEERLKEVKAAWEQMAKENISLVCTEDTIQNVKSARAAMTKQFNELEALRKAVKAQYMAAYNVFEATYKECITEPYRRADSGLKRKIEEVEGEIKASCERRCRGYFEELCAVHGVDFLRYEQAGLKVTLTEAKKKTPSGLYDNLSEFVARVACDVDAIDGMNSNEGMEVMAEYKTNGLNLAKAQKTVRDRREAAKAERKAAEERAERQKRETEAVAKVEAAASVVAPPVAVDPPKEAKLLTVIFRATGTRAQLIRVREFMKQEGIRYE